MLLSATFTLYRLLKVKLELANEESKLEDIGNELMRRFWRIFPWNGTDSSNNDKINR